MYSNSVASIVSKNIGNTLSNFKTWGNILINVKEYGAKGDLVADDTAAIQSAANFALSSGSTLFFPPGRYLISSSLIIPSALTIKGSGPGISELFTSVNIPMIVLNTDLSQFYYGSISELGFVGNISGTRTDNAGILIIGSPSGSNYFNFNTFENLLFSGTYYGIRSTKSSGEAENKFDWNLFTQIKTTNFGTNNVEHAIKFEYGSGTGNVFDACNIVANTSGLEWGGSDDQNIGDITISDCQFGGGGSGIKATKGATSYGSNITITGCQWDAGVVYGVNFTNMTGFSITGCLWGGATGHRLEGCSNYSIEAAGNIESTYGVEKTGIAIGATEDLFSFTFPSGGYESLFIEVVTIGFMQGVGTRIVTSTYLVEWNLTNATWTQVSETATGGTGDKLSHVTTGGSTPKISVATVGVSSDSSTKTQMRLIGQKYKVTV